MVQQPRSKGHLNLQIHSRDVLRSFFHHRELLYHPCFVLLKSGSRAIRSGVLCGFGDVFKWRVWLLKGEKGSGHHGICNIWLAARYKGPALGQNKAETHRNHEGVLVHQGNYQRQAGGPLF